MIRKIAAAFYANIHMAGDIADAKRTCARRCLQGLCVTVTPTEFIYAGGRETGFVVGLVNYPKFPTEDADILRTAEALAMDLIVDLHQHSALIQTPDAAVWMTRREGHGDD